MAGQSRPTWGVSRSAASLYGRWPEGLARNPVFLLSSRRSQAEAAGGSPPKVGRGPGPEIQPWWVQPGWMVGLLLV